MSWILVDKKEINGEMDLGGGNFEVIPNGTTCLAFIKEAKWDIYEDDKYINLKWCILEPTEYKNRVIFQKIKILDNDEKKAKKAQSMLLTIDFNAKGKLSECKELPSTLELQKNLCNKPMMITLRVWEINDKTGNWISSVAPKGAKVADKVVEVEMAIEDNEAEIPF
jgi:hypothetical protein